MNKRWTLLLVLAACGKGDSRSKLDPVMETKPPPTTPATPTPPKPGELSLPPVDTSKWETVALSKLGEDKLPFEGKLKIPSGSRTSTTGLFDSDRNPMGLMAYVTLPDGVKVMLDVRKKESEKDPALLKQMLQDAGRLVIDRRDATGYMLVYQRDEGFLVQGAMWPVEPGLDCATEQPLTIQQLAETLAVCASFAK